MTSLNTIIPPEYIKQNKKLRWLEKWRCKNCFAVYAEYVNGCPKCASGEVGGSHKVLPDKITIADVINNSEELFGNHYVEYVGDTEKILNYVLVSHGILSYCQQNKSIDYISKFIIKNIKYIVY